MNDFGHVDEAARLSIRHDLGRSLFVEAGAGTGKTTEMVERITTLLAEGVATVDQIAAITFTEAAASELRERIGRSLERRSARSDGHVADRLELAIAGLDTAAIGTLHGFARRLLADFPFEAGLPPGFEVAEQIDVDRRWNAFVEGLLDGTADVDLTSLQWAFALGVSVEHLEKIAGRCQERWDQLVGIALVSERPPRADPDLSPSVRPIVDAISHAVALRDHCDNPNDRLFVHVVKLASFLADVEGAASQVGSTPHRLVVEFVRLPKLTCGNAGDPKAWDGHKPEIVAFLRQAEEARSTLRGRMVGVALREVLRVVSAFTLEAVAARRREGRLSFHDLLVGARDLLVEHPEVAAALRDRFTHLFIDEFQDTDPLQIEIVLRILSPDGPGGPGDPLGVVPGSLFVVGDPKQSIYRFRRADLSQYAAIKERSGGDLVSLVSNHRSGEPILAWINAVSTELLTATVDYEDLDAARAGEGLEGPPVVLLRSDDGSGGADEVRQAEAADVASIVRRAVDEGWEVVGKPGGHVRAARLSDCCVLLPSRLNLPHLRGAFEEAGIGYRLESTSLVYDAEEIRELLSILQAVDDPGDEVAIVAALRSTIFACSDADLLRWHNGSGRWDYRRPPPDSLFDTPVARAFSTLKDWFDSRWWTDVGTLIDRIIEERSLLAIGLEAPRPREVWRRYHYAAAEARRFADSIGGDLRAYLRWAESQRDDASRVSEVVLPEPDDDAVRVMTIHTAKGLEFPITIVTGLDRMRTTPKRPTVLFGPDGPELAIRADLATEGFKGLEEVEREADDAERLRLFYVAATRAQDHLVVSLHHDPKVTCLAKQLTEFVSRPSVEPLAVSLALAPAQPPPPSSPAVAEASDAMVDLSAASLARWAADRRVVMDAQELPRVIAATAVAGLKERLEGGVRESDGAGEVKESEEFDEPEDDDAGMGTARVWRRGRAGTSIGRAVHATLQRIDLKTRGELEALAANEAALEGVADRVAEIIARVRSALASPEVTEAVASGRYWREIYVGAPVHGRVVEGFIDLLVDGPGGLHVVDYKTDREAGEELGDRYRLQGATYALAVGEVSGRPVVKVTMLFLRVDGVERRVLDGEELVASMAEVRSLLAAAH